MQWQLQESARRSSRKPHLSLKEEELPLVWVLHPSQVPVPAHLTDQIARSDPHAIVFLMFLSLFQLLLQLPSLMNLKRPLDETR